MSIQNEYDILSKYKNLFPDTFLNSIKDGCTWLANHNNITYQTTTMIRTDNNIYNNSGSTALRLGLIDIDNPLSGLNFYDILAVVEITDNTTGNIVFKIKTKYKTPMGLELILIPINYVIPSVKEEEKVKEYYTKEEVDVLIKDTVSNIDLSKYATLEITNGIRLDLGQLQNKVNTLHPDDEVKYNPQVIIEALKNDEEFKQSVTGPQGPKGDTGDVGPQGEQGLQGNNGKDGVDGTSVSIEEVKPVLLEALKLDETFKNELKGEQGEPGKNGKDGISPTSTEIADILKQDQDFKDSVKGEQGIPGASADKEEVINAIKNDTEFKNSITPDISNLVNVDSLNEVKTTLDTKLDKTALDNYITSDEIAKTYITKEISNKTYLQQTLYATEKANTLALKRDLESYATKDSIKSLTNDVNTKADNSAIVDMLTKTEAGTTYLTKNDASSTYLSKNEAEQTYQLKTTE